MLPLHVDQHVSSLSSSPRRAKGQAGRAARALGVLSREAELIERLPRDSLPQISWWQRGQERARAAEVAEDEGLQYIATLNSDTLGQAHRRGFDPRPYLREPGLTDALDTGGLFGFRF